MKKSFESELARTRNAIKRLRAIREDNLEDYFHDVIIKAIQKGKPLDEHLGYVYKGVWWRINSGKEGGHHHLPLHESVLPGHRHNIDLEIDIKKALEAITPTQKECIYNYFYEGMTLEEIAVHRGIAAQNVERAINRGLASMKKVLRG